jgi:geranylgeranyl transferase type-1 subunit beta
MLFAFFIVSALDLLGLLDDEALETETGKVTGKPRITREEKQGWVEWVYHCQHLDGGFRGFTGTIVGVEGEEEEERGDGRGRGNEWDSANLPATFFALCVLLILGDDLMRVERGKCLRWVKRLQRGDGSFGEVLSSGDQIEGGRDLRFCCCAAGIVYILGDRLGNEDDASIMFDESAMVRYIRSCQSYEGGFSEGPFREAHSGLNYCGIAALSFLSKLTGRGHDLSRLRELGATYWETIDVDACVKWMLLRQTTYIEDEEDADAQSDDESTSHATKPTSRLTQSAQDGGSSTTALYAGFNGRTNKIADTCYAFWNVGALAILDKQYLINSGRLRAYLLEKVQHPIGGFGKGVSEPPDVLHAYLGLATLGLLGVDGFKRVEPTLCVSRSVAGRVGGFVWKRGGGGR